MSETNTLLEKLDTLVARFEEVSTLITDPAVIADQKRYVKLTKEYKELGDLMKARKEYVQVLGGIDEAKDIIANETDPEMRDMAREELDRCEARRPQLEEEIKLLLIPADPQDSRNAILEIRGGTGGDEAALFAGDLFRMYSKYGLATGGVQCQRRRGGRIQGNHLLGDGRGCVWHAEVRERRAPRAACPGYGDTGPGTYIRRIRGRTA